MSHTVSHTTHTRAGATLGTHTAHWPEQWGLSTWRRASIRPRPRCRARAAGEAPACGGGQTSRPTAAALVREPRRTRRPDTPLVFCPGTPGRARGRKGAAPRRLRRPTGTPRTARPQRGLGRCCRSSRAGNTPSRRARRLQPAQQHHARPRPRSRPPARRRGQAAAAPAAGRPWECSARVRAPAGSRTGRACAATAPQPPAPAGATRRRGPSARGRGGQQPLGRRPRQDMPDAGGRPPRTAAGAQVRSTTGEHARKRACRPWAVAYGRSTDSATTQQPQPPPQRALNRARAGPSRHAASPPAATASRRPHTGRPQFEPAEPAGRAASRAASPRPWRAEPGGWRLGHLGSATSARVAEPLWAGGSARFRAGPDGRPARSGGWLSPIGGVAQPDLAGGSDRLGVWLSPIWPVAGRVAGGSATHQIGLKPPLTGQRFLAWGSRPRPGGRAAPLSLGRHHKPFGSVRIARSLHGLDLV